MEARLAMAKKDTAAAIEHFRLAVEAQDKLSYDEPADWFYPVRESLGAALLQNGNAAEAEQVFRADLTKNLRNGRSLFGLMESLKAQKNQIAVEFVRPEFEAAWKNADAPLKIEDL